MSDPINNKLTNYPIITGRPDAQAPSTTRAPVTQGGKTFQEILDARLQQQTRELTFSKHATERVAQRGVELSPDDYSRLERAVGMAEEKGITDSLVYLNETAFIVNIPNRVVVTVVDGSDTQQTVITNINGAVIG